MPGDTGATQIVAWWGAILSTILFRWDIIRWFRSGPLLNIKASPNMRLVPSSDDKPYIYVEVANTGAKATTVTHFVGCYYPSRWAKLRGTRAATHSLVNSGAGGPSVPFKLDTGDRWTGMCEQTAELEKWAREGLLYIGSHHSSAARPLLERVMLPAA